MTKTCICGRVIEWNPNYQNPSGKLGRFMEVATGQVHNCPQWVPQRRQQEFADNKAKYGSTYAGPSPQFVTKEEFQEVKDQLFNMEQTLANLGKAVGEMSFKPASDLQTTDVVE